VSDPITLPPLGAPVDELWDVLLDLSERLSDVPWSLIGGQMVLLHALEHDTVPPQVSQDGDVITNVRLATGGLARVVAELEGLGFSCDGMAPDGIAHRYSRPSRDPKRPVVIDVLAPEGVGSRTDLPLPRPGAPSKSPAAARPCVAPKQWPW